MKIGPLFERFSRDVAKKNLRECTKEMLFETFARTMKTKVSKRFFSQVFPITKWTSPSIYAKTTLDANRASSLPGNAYHDPALFELEKEKVFNNGWVAIAEQASVRGTGTLLPKQLCDTNIVLTNDGESVKTFKNTCLHRGAQLVAEKCHKKATILCPYHRWSYRLDKAEAKHFTSVTDIQTHIERQSGDAFAAASAGAPAGSHTLTNGGDPLSIQ
jgi:nitrite reductase/ring-hydroxylating ferredoxin subunit